MLPNWSCDPVDISCDLVDGSCDIKWVVLNLLQLNWGNEGHSHSLWPQKNTHIHTQYIYIYI